MLKDGVRGGGGGGGGGCLDIKMPFSAIVH